MFHRLKLSKFCIPVSLYICILFALQEMADEVLDSIVDSFRYPEQDTAWHGGCLALAEVARRGLLLPHRVPELAPTMATALQYDLRRGAHRSVHR